MPDVFAEKNSPSRLFQLVEQILRSSQPAIGKSHSCVVNDIPQDLFIESDPEMLSTVISGMLGIAIVHAHDSFIRISAGLADNMVTLSMRDFNRFNSYSNPSGLRTIQGLAARLGGTLAVASMRQGEKTISLRLPCRREKALSGVTTKTGIPMAVPG